MATPEEIQSVFPPMPEDSIPEDMVLLNTLAELGQTDSDAKVNVYRSSTAKGNKGGAFLFSCSPDEFTLEKLRDEYGGGDYRIHVRANGSIIANRLVSVEEPKKLPVSVAPQIQSAEMMQPISELTRAMMVGFENMGKLIIQAQPKQESRADMLKELLLYKELFGSSKSEINPLDFVKQGIELAKDLRPSDKEAGTMDVMMQLLDTFGKPIAEAVSNAQTLHRQALSNAPTSFQPPVQVSNAPALMAPIPDNQAQLTSDQDKQIMDAMKGYLNFLIAQAQAGNDVYTYAGMVLDQAPPEQIDSFIDRPDWLEYLANFEPAVKDHEAWFSQLRDAIKELLTMPPEDDINTSISTGGLQNALGNSNDSNPS